MRACYGLGALLLLALFPVAQADPGPDGSGCNNNGIILMQGVNNQYSCSTSESGCDNHGAVVLTGTYNTYACSSEGSCHNRGAVVLVGPGNTYRCDGGCTNSGLVLNALGDYCGSGAVHICAGRLCIEQDGAAIELAPTSQDPVGTG